MLSVIIGQGVPRMPAPKRPHAESLRDTEPSD